MSLEVKNGDVFQEAVSADSAEAGPMALLTGNLLMFRQYRSGKVEARSEVKTRHGSDLVSLVVIPDTYQGTVSSVFFNNSTFIFLGPDSLN